MKKINAMLLCFLLIATASLVAQNGGVDFSGTAETLWGVGMPWASENSWTDSDTAGQFLVGDTSFTGTVDAYYGQSSALADGTVGFDATLKELYFSLNELYVDYSAAFWGVRVGRQKAAWGKADGITITNVLCPQDMSSVGALFADDNSLGVDALRFSVNGNSFTADAWWIPFFRGTQLPLEDGNRLRKYLVPEAVDLSAKIPGATSIPVAIGALSEPETAIWNGEYGLKLSGYFSLCDVSLYGFYGWDDAPLMSYTLSDAAGTAIDLSNPMAYASLAQIVVSGSYERMTMIGADAAFPIGEVVLRTEAAFFPSRHFQKSAEAILTDAATAAATGSSYTTSEQRNELSALAGLDWMPSGWTITAQYFCDVVFGDLEKLEREDAYTHGATISVSKSLLNETLSLSLAGLVNFNAFDSAITLSADYSISDQITFSAGAAVFLPGPEQDGTYGAYKDLSTVYAGAKFSF